jgi:two-component system chemotaxis response regulator CheY
MSRVILVVDDSPTMRGMVSHTLNEAGFETKEAENGKDALIKLTMMEEGGTKPDVIVTDINMPEMDGIELVKEIRKLSAFKHVPVLVLTTDNTDEKKEVGRAAGATGWLVKPFDSELILKVIRKVLPA